MSNEWPAAGAAVVRTRDNPAGHTRRIMKNICKTQANPVEKTTVIRVSIVEDDVAAREILVGWLARGFLYKEIAEALSISIRTVDTYIRRIYEKLHVRSRAQAVAKYVTFPFADSRATGAK